MIQGLCVCVCVVLCVFISSIQVNLCLDCWKDEMGNLNQQIWRGVNVRKSKLLLWMLSNTHIHTFINFGEKNSESSYWPRGDKWKLVACLLLFYSTENSTLKFLTLLFITIFYWKPKYFHVPLWTELFVDLLPVFLTQFNIFNGTSPYQGCCISH